MFLVGSSTLADEVKLARDKMLFLLNLGSAVGTSKLAEEAKLARDKMLFLLNLGTAAGACRVWIGSSACAEGTTSMLDLADLE